MRRLDFGSPEERLICLILEFSYLLGRDVAVFHEQNHLARLRNMSKTRISITLDGLVNARVIERRGATIRFRPPSGWHRPERNRRNPQEQLSLEDWLRSSGLQGTLNLFELDEGVVETWLESGVSPSETPTSAAPVKHASVSPSETGIGKRAVHLALAVSPSETASGTNISRSRVLEIQEPQSRVHRGGRGYWDDGYVTDKLSRRRLLKEELQRNTTPMARRFEKLYATKPDRARELIAMAVDLECQNGKQPNPNAWLNTALANEGIEY